jgi:Domain of unknown function (DUF4349)
MSTLTESIGANKKAMLWMASGFVVALMVAGVVMPNLMKSHIAEDKSVTFAQQRAFETGLTHDSFASASKTRTAWETTSLATASLPAKAIATVPDGRNDDRKMVRTSSMALIVQNPAEVSEKIRALAEGMGGYLVSSEVTGGRDATKGSLTIRVPAARYEEARAAIRKLGVRIESEKVEAQDMTRQYVDDEAGLRNLRAAETQYLAILKQARTVKDTLAVSDKLSEVRGEIEQQQAEFDTLSKQVETVAIAVSLQAEAEAQVFGLQWRPLYQIKLALRDGLDGLGDYATTMTAIILYLPTIILWLATILVGAILGWKVLRWVARVFFSWPKPPALQNG